MVFIVVLLVIFVSLNKLKYDTTTVLEAYCNQLGGEYIFYECYHAPLYPSCEKEGIYCDFPDGTSISEKELSKSFNGTMI